VYFPSPKRQTSRPVRAAFRVVWGRGRGGLVEFPALVWQGVAYANNMWGTMHALSMRDGRVLWRSPIGTRVAGGGRSLIPGWTWFRAFEPPYVGHRTARRYRRRV
jgi:hypothetical protein